MHESTNVRASVHDVRSDDVHRLQRAREAKAVLMENLKGGVLTLEHRYEIERVLEENALATCYRATVHPFQYDVDVWTFQGFESLDMPTPIVQSIVERLRDTARQTSSLRGQHVIRVLDYGDLGKDGWFQVSDGVRGATLHEIIRHQGPLPLEGVSMVVDQVAQALQEAHDAGFGHLAVRPEHVWFEETPAGTFARLGGFGFTLLRHELTLVGSKAQPAIPLTVDHLAPESLEDPVGTKWLASIRKETDIDTLLSAPADDWGHVAGTLPTPDRSPTPRDYQAADVFGLAVLTYKALVDQHPFIDDFHSPWFKQVHAILEADLRPPSLFDVSLPPKVWNVLKSGLAREPAARPRTPMDFARLLREALSSPSKAETRSKPRSVTLPTPAVLTARNTLEEAAITIPDRGPLSLDLDLRADLSHDIDSIPEPPPRPSESPLDVRRLMRHPNARYIVAGLVALLLINVLMIILAFSDDDDPSPSDTDTPPIAAPSPEDPQPINAKTSSPPPDDEVFHIGTVAQ